MSRPPVERKVLLDYRLAADVVDVYAVEIHHNEGRRRVFDHAEWAWVDVPMGCEAKPTLRLPMEIAGLLSDELRKLVD